MFDNPTSNDKRLPLIGLVVCLAVFVFASLAAAYLFFFSPSVPAPPLVIEPKVVDFGIVAEGKYEAAFTLKNSSSQPISILHTVGGCSCTTISLRKTLIPPRSAVTVDCTLDTTGKSDSFQSSVIVGYMLGDVSLIDEEMSVKPTYAFVDLRATVEVAETENE